MFDFTPPACYFRVCGTEGRVWYLPSGPHRKGGGGGGGGRERDPGRPEDPDNNCTHFLFPCPWHVIFMQKFAGPDKTVAVCFETVGPVDGEVALALRCPPLFAHPCTMKLFAGHSCCLATVTPRWKSARKTGLRRQVKLLRNDVCVCVCTRILFPSPDCDTHTHPHAHTSVIIIITCNKPFCPVTLPASYMTPRETNRDKRQQCQHFILSLGLLFRMFPFPGEFCSRESRHTPRYWQ